jgi:hypothetical protein
LHHKSWCLIEIALQWWLLLAANLTAQKSEPSTTVSVPDVAAALSIAEPALIKKAAAVLRSS